MSPKTTVTVDADWLLERLLDIERAIADIRTAAAQGVSARATLSGINVRLIEWMDKDSQRARDEDVWAWAFAYHEDGQLRDETRQLVEEIHRYEKVEVSGYEITLSGRDKRLLNRKKMKTQER